MGDGHQVAAQLLVLARPQGGLELVFGGAGRGVHDAHGHQVAYNGHLLYTFASDRAGQVTGQGVQNFFVATPGLTTITGTPAPGTVPAAPPAHGYGY